MSDAAYIELSAQKKPRFPWLRGWRGLLLLLLGLALAACAYFSWWLAEGKLVPAYARVDTKVYTVAAPFPTTIEQLLVQPGQDVEAGQPLARIDARAFAERLKASGKFSPASEAQAQPEEDPGEALGIMEEEEKRMTARLAQAQMQEERYRQAHQQMVTEHVRAQLALRGLSNNHVMGEQAREMEAQARARMDWAKEEYEKVSQARWAIDRELAKIKAEVLRRKRVGYRPPPPPPVPKPDARFEQAIEQASVLYSPARGQIVGVNGQPGSPMNGGETVFAIMPTGSQAPPKWIQAWFPASKRKDLAPGQEAQIRVNDKTIIGNVSAVSPADQSLPGGDGNTPYVPVQIQIIDQQALANLAPGAKVECQIQTRDFPGEEIFAMLWDMMQRF